MSNTYINSTKQIDMNKLDFEDWLEEEHAISRPSNFHRELYFNEYQEYLNN